MIKRETVLAVFWIVLLVAIGCVFSYSLYKQDKDLVEKVVSGEAVLMCHMKDGYRRIEPANVEWYSEGRWYFTNGSATRCSTYRLTTKLK